MVESRRYYKISGFSPVLRYPLGVSVLQYLVVSFPPGYLTPLSALIRSPPVVRVLCQVVATALFCFSTGQLEAWCASAGAERRVRRPFRKLILEVWLCLSGIVQETPHT